MGVRLASRKRPKVGVGASNLIIIKSCLLAEVFNWTLPHTLLLLSLFFSFRAIVVIDPYGMKTIAGNVLGPDLALNL